MRIYVGFDDTDTLDCDYGTGKVARWFANDLPAGCRAWGAVRQQLLVDDAIPFTSHNSAACVVIEASRDGGVVLEVVRCAQAHVVRHAADGSDPGVCVIAEDAPELAKLMEFGLACTRRVMTQEDALRASRGSHLSGHGGSNDGIIGAAAAVGLTAAGWYGRFIEFGDLRRLPAELRVKELGDQGIRVMSMDRDAFVPHPEDLVQTQSWVRPRLMAGQPVLTVVRKDPGVWETMGGRRGRKAKGHPA